jgi:hypothetical protein
MATPAAKIIDEILALRARKLFAVIFIAGVCFLIFGYAVLQLTSVLAVKTLFMDRLDGDDVRNADDDDVDLPPPADEYDPALDAGHRIGHGLKMAMNRFNAYNAEAREIANRYDQPHLYTEVKKDLRILDASQDSWAPSPLSAAANKSDDAHFSTYNTLTGV